MVVVNNIPYSPGFCYKRILYGTYLQGFFFLYSHTQLQKTGTDANALQMNQVDTNTTVQTVP